MKKLKKLQAQPDNSEKSMNETQQPVEKTVVNANFLIKATNIIKKYGEKTVLKGFNIEIKPGERIGIIGANGSGKSTITEILASIRKPTSGTIEKKTVLLLDFNFKNQNIHQELQLWIC
ncbi:ATP-binding cassette domain-containing protein [Spiroplasma sp. AdecLV25b]|uniref:ATP-binding cassette domain-containing protein n=1 Tax=Spiroplasma sp. AdecLV25b TaxID=3027162 RepID=UPI0027DFB9AB|nr:ATP-binding cassette domain-containing protein [Spiroplasma sp. AdecLV25b]